MCMRTITSVVDTYWQTETGGHIAANLPGIYLTLFYYRYGSMLITCIYTCTINCYSRHCSYKAWLMRLSLLRRRLRCARPLGAYLYIPYLLLLIALLIC